jgi:hypothetical protein
MERVEHNMSGGYLATFTVMAVTYVSGLALDASGWLSEAWSHVTPGQAAFVLGLLTYLTAHGPKLLGWLRAMASRVRRLRAGGGPGR